MSLIAAGIATQIPTHTLILKSGIDDNFNMQKQH